MNSNPLIAAAANTPFPNPKRTMVQNRYSQLDTKGVIAAEHKIELSDLIQESTTELRAIYRSKLLFGDYLKYVDANFSGDGVGEFNVAVPPPFEPGYASKKQDVKQGDGGEGETTKDKLRTAEELIKKLYKRNSLLEVENKYLQSELSRKEAAKESEKPAQNRVPDNEIGQIPRHPLVNRRMLRRCKSCPPTRLILKSAIGGDRNRQKHSEKEPVGKETKNVAESTGAAMLKQKVLSLTEALVTSQHENNRLSKEKQEKISLRDSLIKKYFVERDGAIAQLHSLLKEIAEKVNNPMRLTKVKQPSNNINPVVAGNNILKEAGEKISDQISHVTSSLLSSGNPKTEDLLKASTDVPRPELSGRRRELVRRVHNTIESIPLAKKKSLLSLLLEIKQVNRALVDSNTTIMATYESLKSKLNDELIQEKLEAALLRDQVRSLGGIVDDDVGGLANVGGAAGV